MHDCWSCCRGRLDIVLDNIMDVVQVFLNDIPVFAIVAEALHPSLAQRLRNLMGLRAHSRQPLTLVKEDADKMRANIQMQRDPLTSCP
jgi:hypothetical protein